MQFTLGHSLACCSQISFDADLILFEAVKEYWKSVNVWRSYQHEFFVIYFLGHRVPNISSNIRVYCASLSLSSTRRVVCLTSILTSCHANILSSCWWLPSTPLHVRKPGIPVRFRRGCYPGPTSSKQSSKGSQLITHADNVHIFWLP